MKNYHIYIMLFILFLMSSCKVGDSKVLHNDTDGEVLASSTVELPEPDIGTDESRFRLTELATAEKRNFEINDSIVFTGLEKKLNTPGAFRDVQLRIKSHCIVGTEDVLIKEFNRELSASIPIIELLSQEVLSPQENNPPSCGFSFTATHKEGSAHHFEIPSLPITDYDSHRFIQLSNSSGTMSESFNFVFMNRVSEYLLDTGIEEPMDTLDLVCSDFSLSISVRSQQLIPLSAFPFGTLPENILKKVHEERPNQQCRIFGYKSKILVGVSSIFHLMYPQPSLSVSIKDDLFENKAEYFQSQIIKSHTQAHTPEDDIPLYTYRISNPHPYPVYIWIENYQERNLLLGYYGLYFKSSRHRAFYAKTEEELVLSSIQTTQGRSSQRKMEEGTFIRLEPNSAISFSAMLTMGFRLCGRGSTWLGSAVVYPDLKIYQLISDNIESISLSQNTLYELDTHAGKYFSIIASLLDTVERRSYDSLFFDKNNCSGGITWTSRTHPIIELYSAKPIRLRFVPTTTHINKKKFYSTDHTLNSHFK